MDNLNVVNDTQQTVVESASKASSENISGTETGTPDKGANTGTAPRNQSKADNRAFAQLRREKESSDAAMTKLMNGLSDIGYKGATPEDVLDMIRAEKEGTTVEKLRQARNDKLAAVKNHPEYRAMEQRMIEYGMAEDLREVQTIDPNVQSIDELGDEYLKLRASGISPRVAFAAVKAGESPATGKPKSIGAVSDPGNVEGEYFTEAQLDKLTAKDLENPKIYKKAMKSLVKL